MTLAFYLFCILGCLGIIVISLLVALSPFVGIAIWSIYGAASMALAYLAIHGKE